MTTMGKNKEKFEYPKELNFCRHSLGSLQEIINLIDFDPKLCGMYKDGICCMDDYFCEIKKYILIMK